MSFKGMAAELLRGRDEGGVFTRAERCTAQPADPQAMPGSVYADPWPSYSNIYGLYSVRRKSGTVSSSQLCGGLQPSTSDANLDCYADECGSRSVRVV